MARLRLSKEQLHALVKTIVDAFDQPQFDSRCNLNAADGWTTSWAFRCRGPWQWRPYGGSNPHDHHIHISVQAEPSGLGDAADWKVTV